jgi:hypothetical protein
MTAHGDNRLEDVRLLTAPYGFIDLDHIQSVVLIFRLYSLKMRPMTLP